MRTITAPLAAILGAAVLAASAVAAPADSHHQADSWYAGKSTIAGSTSDSQNGTAAAKANVYVPPAGAYHGIAPAKANVYVPPASEYHGTVTPAASGWPANPTPVQPQHATASTSSDFDWGSAAIGAAAAIGASLIAFGAAVAIRRRRHVDPVTSG